MADITTVAVVGAGTMGAGIAGVFARAGCDVRLVDLSGDLVRRGLEMIALAQESLVHEGLLTAAAAEAALGRIRSLTELEPACDGVQLLVECVPEDLALKQEMFARCDRLCPPDAILTSNTSGLSISALAAATARPALVAGLHFWNPPHVVPLVEVTKGQGTAEETATLLVELCRRIGKQPILVRHDVPGFVGNRLQHAVIREALYILDQGIASAEDIDTAMTAGPGLRYSVIGPLRTMDLGGVDVFLAISSYLYAALSNDPGPAAVLQRLVQQGRLGAKSGAGIYDYDEQERRRIIAQRDRLLLRILKLWQAEGGS